MSPKRIHQRYEIESNYKQRRERALSDLTDGSSGESASTTIAYHATTRAEPFFLDETVLGHIVGRYIARKIDLTVTAADGM